MKFTEIFIVYKWDKKEYLVGEQYIGMGKHVGIGGFKKLRKALKVMKYIQKHGSDCDIPLRMLYTKKEMRESKKLQQEYHKLKSKEI